MNASEPAIVQSIAATNQRKQTMKLTHYFRGYYTVNERDNNPEFYTWLAVNDDFGNIVQVPIDAIYQFVYFTVAGDFHAM